MLLLHDARDSELGKGRDVRQAAHVRRDLHSLPDFLVRRRRVPADTVHGVERVERGHEVLVGLEAALGRLGVDLRQGKELVGGPLCAQALLSRESQA